MKKLRQILIGSITGAVLSFSSGCGPALLAYMVADGLAEEKPFQSWNIKIGGKPLYADKTETSLEHSSLSTLKSEEVYNSQKKADNQELAIDSFPTKQFFERKAPSLEIGALAYSTNSELNEFFDYQQRLNYLEAEISKLTDSDKNKTARKFWKFRGIRSLLRLFKKRSDRAEFAS